MRYLLPLVVCLVSCPLTDDPIEGSIGMNPALYGVWRSGSGQYFEEFTVSPERTDPADTTSLGVFIAPGYEGYGPYNVAKFQGEIRYAASFSDRSGILIVEYHAGHKQVWVDWEASDPTNGTTWVLRNPQPAGNFYGIYYLDLASDGNRVFLALTNAQDDNYGPTEALTLPEAIEKFTLGNMNQLLDLSVGDPQTKYEDL
jgi:hypothetical protein